MKFLDFFIPVISSLIGTFGFGVLFNARGKKLALISLGGGLCCVFYLAFIWLSVNDVLSCLLSSLLVSIYAEILARRLKTPVSVFSIPCLIPLIPGGALYYSIKFALSSDLLSFVSRATHTLSIAAALSLGVIIVNTVTRIIAKPNKTNEKPQF